MKKSDYHTGFVYLLEILYKSKANFNVVFFAVQKEGKLTVGDRLSVLSFYL